MKTGIPLITFILLVFGMLGPAGTMQSQESVHQVERLVKSGDARELVALFNDPVNLKIRDMEGIYSLDHSRMALQKFFKEHPPESFTINHEGESNEGFFAIGNYKCTQSHSFRIYFLVRQEKSLPKVLQFFIEED